jgi:protoheme IX farnesyltransferase
MIQKTETLDSELSRIYGRVVAFIELAKLRLVLMVLITTFVGFYLASPDTFDWAKLIHTTISIGLAAGGVLALNQYLEREQDAQMARTRHRPLPDKRLQPAEALIFGVALTIVGLLYLTSVVNILSGLVVSAIVVSYLFIYTPLKQKSSLCTVAGAIPGALPPVAGWVAARGTFNLEAGVLFAILFLWQLPHSLSIACLYRDEYAQAGFRLLPVIHPDGESTRRQIVSNSLGLLVVALIPTLIGLAGVVYFFASLLLSSVFLAFGIHFAVSRSTAAAKHLLHASLVYLPLTFLMMAFDKVM